MAQACSRPRHRKAPPFLGWCWPPSKNDPFPHQRPSSLQGRALLESSVAPTSRLLAALVSFLVLFPDSICCAPAPSPQQPPNHWRTLCVESPLASRAPGSLTTRPSLITSCRPVCVFPSPRVLLSPPFRTLKVPLSFHTSLPAVTPDWTSPTGTALGLPCQDHICQSAPPRPGGRTCGSLPPPAPWC